VLSQGPIFQESVMVDLADIDIRKRRKMNNLDDIDIEDYGNRVRSLLNVSRGGSKGVLSSLV